MIDLSKDNFCVGERQELMLNCIHFYVFMQTFIVLVTITIVFKTVAF